MLLRCARSTRLLYTVYRVLKLRTLFERVHARHMMAHAMAIQLTNGTCVPGAGGRGGRHGDSRAASNTFIGHRPGKGPGKEAKAGRRVTSSQCKLEKIYIFRGGLYVLPNISHDTTRSPDSDTVTCSIRRGETSVKQSHAAHKTLWRLLFTA